MSEEKEEKKTEGAEGEASAEAAKPSSKKKLIIIAAVAFLVLAGGGAGVFFGVMKGGKHAEEKTEEAGGAKKDESKDEKKDGHAEKKDEGHKEEAKPGEKGKEGEGSAAQPIAGQPIYLDLQEFLVNLNTGGKQTSFLKLVVTLEIANMESKAAVEANMPRIRDSFQVYLRELRTEDLRGSAGLQLLREELLLRINKIISPAKVDDILFKEVIVQ